MGLNHIWARLVIEELVRCGVTTLCISPGSRSTPLVIAAAENKQACTVVHTDERGAGFCAVGYGKATGRPAVLICTSGTAVANYFPAVIEASQSNIPLLILSSDRPVELRDSCSPQTINQVNIFGDYVRWQFDVPAPDPAAIAPDAPYTVSLEGCQIFVVARFTNTDTSSFELTDTSLRDAWEKFAPALIR